MVVRFECFAFTDCGFRSLVMVCGCGLLGLWFGILFIVCFFTFFICGYYFEFVVLGHWCGFRWLRVACFGV